MRGIEPRAFHMQSERSTTELHPLYTTGLMLYLITTKAVQYQKCWHYQKGYCTHGGTRTPNLRFRRPTPYPLGHAGTHTSELFYTALHHNRC